MKNKIDAVLFSIENMAATRTAQMETTFLFLPQGTYKQLATLGATWQVRFRSKSDMVTETLCTKQTKNGRPVEQGLTRNFTVLTCIPVARAF